MRHTAWVLTLGLCGLMGCMVWGRRGPSAPPEAVAPLVDDLAYADAKAARDAWQPMAEEAQVSVVTLDGRRALRMPCPFKGTTFSRASWDRSVTLDLTACRGMRFDVFCPNARPVSHFSFYMHSGNGWYSAGFSPSGRKGWSTVRIGKADTRIEDKPAGWGTVDTIRISAWRGTDVNTEFYIANLAVDGADAPIAILRGESAVARSVDERRSVAMFSKGMSQALDQLGLSYVVMSDIDTTAERLKGKQIVILPHNPGMPDDVADQLVRFVKAGGRVMSCYGLHSKLGEVLGMEVGEHVRQTYSGHFATIRATGKGLTGMPPVVGQGSWNIHRAKPVGDRSRVAATWFNDKGQSTGEPAILASDTGVLLTHVLLGDDPVHKQGMLLAMLGHLMPKLWEQVSGSAVERIGRFGAYAGFDEAARGIRRQARRDKAATDALGQARTLRDKAAALNAARKFPEAMAAAAQAHDSMLTAYCLAQKPKKREHRAWWCHSAFGVAGMTWDEAIKNLADNGFTAILPNMLWGGTAYYTSAVLPVAPEVAEKGDQIALCLAACKKYGVECHPWKVNWNMSGRATKEFVERMQREGRTQVSYDGTSNPRWLCPSHPANQKLEIDAMVEVATKYDVDGVHFDYIRYPGPQSCFCPGCRERFEKLIGAKVANWPADVRDDEALKQKWLAFRRGHITHVVATVSETVHRLKPDVKISAAVFRNAPIDRDNVGQDWQLWCQRRYLDFVCPMDYTPSNTQFENQVRQQRKWAGRVPCYPGIGISCWGSPRDIVKLIEQITITRRLRTGGFTIFNYGVPEAARIVPLCGKGITRRQ